MKNIVIILLVVFSVQQSQAQIEVSTNPLALLFNAYPISASLPFSRDISLGADIFFVPEEDIGLIYLKGRYYFNPEYGADRFHVGTFVGGGSDIGIGIGFLTGYKIMSQRGVFLDLAIGIGRAIGNGDSNTLPYAQLHFGYRFGDKTIESTLRK